MSKTELYIIKRNKHIEFFDSANNAWLGSMHIWQSIEKKYLPSLERYSWENENKKTDEYKSRITQSMVSLFHNNEENPIQEVWNLSFAPDVEWNDRIIMSSTMDNMFIGYKYLPELADAYRTAEYASDNMKTQADIMDKIHEKYTENEIIGIFILGTSVCSVDDQVTFAENDENHEYPMMNDKWYDGMYEMVKFKEFGFDVNKLFEWEKDNKITDYE